MEQDKRVAMLAEEVLETEVKALWVFGYGSLCWRPGFQFHKAITGHVRGFYRRFWQGNTTHRGTEKKGLVHGVAYAISGETAIPYLSKRECDLGGYISNFVDFHPVNGQQAFKVLVYIATPKNPLWLGDGHISEIAEQIVETSGPSGHNVEYLLRLASFMRHHFPGHDDQHLYSLESEVLSKIKNNNMCLKMLMGNGEGCITFAAQERRQLVQNPEENQRVETFEHTTRVPGKVLRCLNI